MRRLALLLIALLIAPALPGCAAVPIATISAAAGAAAATSEVTSAVYKSGKLRAAERAGFDATCEALRRTIDDLGYITLQEKMYGDKRYRVVVRDETYERIVINIQRRTPQVTSMIIDIGWLGEQQVARLFYEQMKQELSKVLAEQRSAPG